MLVFLVFLAIKSRCFDFGHRQAVACFRFHLSMLTAISSWQDLCVVCFVVGGHGSRLLHIQDVQSIGPREQGHVGEHRRHGQRQSEDPRDSVQHAQTGSGELVHLFASVENPSNTCSVRSVMRMFNTHSRSLNDLHKMYLPSYLSL